MSGICASVAWAPPWPAAAHGDTMAAATPFRGHHAAWSAPGAVLVAQSVSPPPHSRLSVDAATGAVAVADVRLDNRTELRSALRRYVAPTGDEPSDADLVLAAWRRWGPECTMHLLGDYAFFIWEPESQRAFGARDPMSMRPLYYRYEPGRRLLVASEITQLLAAPGVTATIDEETVARYLVGKAPIEATAYRDIHQLAPGHSLQADSDGLTSQRFWRLRTSDRIRYRTEGEYHEHFRALFEAAVACRIPDTGRSGILLSGGMDSGSIASMAGRLTSGSTQMTRAYSWAFDELAECDERAVSRIIAGHFDMPATEVAVDDAWPLATFPAHGPHRDEPHIGAFQTGIELLLAAAREDGASVILSGDRGDLLVGDWVMDTPGLLAARQWGLAWRDLRAARARLPEAALRDIVRPLSSSLWPPHRAPQLRRRLQRGAGRVAPLPGWISPDVARLAADVKDVAVPTSIANAARRERFQLVFVPEHQRGMVWSNRTYARYGQEFADPWSDLRLVEFILAIPQWVVQRREDPKHIAKEAMRGVMPEAARAAVRKVTPEPLFERGLRERATGTVLDLLAGSRAAAAGFVDASRAEAHYRNYLQGAELDHEFWSLLCLEWWLRTYW